MTIESRVRDSKKQETANKLEGFEVISQELASKLGLNPFSVKYWIVDYEEMLELMAYGGFPERYPHWRWGMKYEQQKKQQQFIGGKAFELVINDDPAHAYLQASNDLADQKAVITHVEAHSDFFRNNYWFEKLTENYNASHKLSQHSKEIETMLNEYDVTQSEIEQWIDNLLCIEFNVNPFNQYFRTIVDTEDDENESHDELQERLRKEGVSEVVIEEALDEMVDEEEDTEPKDNIEGEQDLLLFLKEFGQQFDNSQNKAIEYEEWQRRLIEIVRSEAFYFAPQRMTKLLNEGWATFWESMMMAGENLASADQVVTYADHLSKVMQPNGFNPYKIGFDLWSYVENYENRDEILTKLLQIDGVTTKNIYETIDFSEVLQELQIDELVNIGNYSKDEVVSAVPNKFLDDTHSEMSEEEFDNHPWKLLSYEGLAVRHYSLLRKGNHSFLKKLDLETLRVDYRYLQQENKYDSIEEALENVSYTVGWDEMFAARETHHDGTFIDQYLTKEFIEEYGYFAYEYNRKDQEFQVSGTDVESVRKKLLLEFTNFGKPLISVQDMNFNNSGELLLQHVHNGINLNVQKAKKVLERLFQLWGKPVHIETVVREKKRNGIKNKAKRFSYSKKDGHNETTLKHNRISDILSEATYDTAPKEWYN